MLLKKYGFQNGGSQWGGTTGSPVTGSLLWWDLERWVLFYVTGSYSKNTYFPTIKQECTILYNNGFNIGNIVKPPVNNSSFQFGWNWIATHKSKYGGYSWTTLPLTLSNESYISIVQSNCLNHNLTDHFPKVPSFAQWVNGCTYAARYYIEWSYPKPY